MFIGNFAVTRFEVIVLCLIVRLRIIAILVRCKNLILGQQEQIIRGRGHVAGGIAVAIIIRILRAGLHHCPQIRGKCGHQRVRGRAGGRACAPQYLASHLTASPAARVRVAGVHRECARRGSRAAVAAIHQTNKLAADLTQQEVDAVAALLAGIVVETDDKGINFQAGDRSRTHLAIDGHGLCGTNRPIVCTLPGIADGLDDCPTVAAERFGHQRNGHRERLARRCSIVGICTHIDRNSGTAGCLCGHRDGGAGNTYRCNVRTARGCGHRTAARPRNSDGARGFRVGQAQTACGQRNTAGRLADRPRSALGRSRPIRPLIIGSRGKGGAVAASVGCAARATDRQLRTVIVAPRRGLRRAIVSHATGLCRHILDLGSADRPRHTLGRSRPIRPLIIGSRGKGGAVAASVGCAARATDRQLRTVIVAPRRGLRRAIVSHATGLCRHILDLGSADRPRHTLGFLRAVRPDILADGRKRGRIGASIDAGGHAPDRHHADVIAFPCGTLGGTSIGQTPALGRHGLNRQGQHRKRINGFLHIRRRDAGLAVVVGNICRSAAGAAATTAAAFLDKLFDPVFRHDLAGFLQLFQSLTGGFGDDFGMGIRGIVVL